MHTELTKSRYCLQPGTVVAVRIDGIEECVAISSVRCDVVRRRTPEGRVYARAVLYTAVTALEEYFPLEPEDIIRVVQMTDLPATLDPDTEPNSI